MQPVSGVWPFLRIWIVLWIAESRPSARSTILIADAFTPHNPVVVTTVASSSMIRLLDRFVLVQDDSTSPPSSSPISSFLRFLPLEAAALSRNSDTSEESASVAASQTSLVGVSNNASFSYSSASDEQANADRVLMLEDDVLGMEELYQSLDSLERALAEKHERYQSLVQKVTHGTTAASDRVTEIDQAMVEDLARQFDDFYAMQVQEKLQEQASMEARARDAQQQKHDTQLQTLAAQHAQNEATSLQKITWLAEQLQHVQMASRKRQLETELAARVQQNELQTRLVDLQGQLATHLEKTATDSATQKQLWKQRRELESEMSTVKRQLSESLSDLKQALRIQGQQRQLEQRRSRDVLSQREAQLKGQLQAVQEQTSSTISHLTRRLHSRQQRNEQALERVTEAHQSQALELRSKLAQVTRDLENGMHDSQIKLDREKEKFARMEESLKAELQLKTEQMNQHLQSTSAQSQVVQMLLQKRSALEKEVTVLRQDYANSMSDWESKLAMESDSSHQEQAKQQALMQQYNVSANARIAKAEHETVSLKAVLVKSLREKDLEHRSSLEHFRDSLSVKSAQLMNQLRRKSEELQHSRAESQRILIHFKNATLAEHAQFLTKLREKEKQLDAQIALTAAAREEANVHATKRTQLEADLSKLHQEYRAACVEWKNKLYELNTDRKQQLQSAFDQLAKRESEARTLLHAANLQTEKNIAWDNRLRAKENQYRQMVRDVQEQSGIEKKRLESNVDEIRKELVAYKSEVDSRLDKSKKSYETKQTSLMLEIASREADLQKHKEMAKSMAEVSKLHLQTKVTLENDLSSLKDAYNSSLSEWKAKLVALQQERIVEQQRMEAKVNEATQKARKEIAMVERKTQDQLHELQKTAVLNATHQRLAFEHLLQSSKNDKTALSSTVQNLSKELHQHKADTQRQLAHARSIADSKVEAAQAQIKVMEEKYADQVQLTVLAEDKLRDQNDLRLQLKNELSSLKHQFKEHSALWQSRLNTLEENRNKTVNVLNEEFTRREAAAQDQIMLLKKEAENIKSVHQSSMQAKERDFEMRENALRESSKGELQEIHLQLKDVGKNYLQLKKDAQTSIENVKAAFQKTQEELRVKVKEKESELAAQVNRTLHHRSEVEGLRIKTAKLVKELSEIKRLHEVNSSAFQIRYKSLQEEQSKVRLETGELIARLTAEAEKKVLSVTNEARQQRLALEAKIKEEAVRHSQALRNVTQMAEVKEKELLLKIQSLEALKLEFEAKHSKSLASENSASLAMKDQFDSEIKNLRSHVTELKELLDVEQTKSKDLLSMRVDLESQLASVQARYEQEIIDWKRRCDDAIRNMHNQKLLLTEERVTKDAFFQKRLDEELASARTLHDSMRREMNQRETTYFDELQRLKDSSIQQETQLRARLQEITQQFDHYRVVSQNQLATAVAYQHSQPEHLAMPSSDREAERTRYELSKQLVRKNVELFQYQVHLKEKDAQIAMLKAGGLMGTETLHRSRINLSAIIERISRLLIGERRNIRDEIKVGGEGKYRGVGNDHVTNYGRSKELPKRRAVAPSYTLDHARDKAQSGKVLERERQFISF